MNLPLRTLQQKVDVLQYRERVLLFGAILALVYVIFEFTLLAPASNKQSDLQGQISKLQTELTTGQKELDTLLNQARQNANTPLQAQIDNLNQLIAAEQNKLTTITKGLVSAEKLPRILEDVLIKTGNLKLQQLHAIPVEELQLTTNEQEGEPRSAGVYKHRVRIVVEGGFSRVLDYLEALQALPWGFHWDEFNYQVDRFPNAKVELQVYTLTTEQGLFGLANQKQESNNG